MKVLFPIIVFSLIMAYLSERYSIATIDQYGRKQYIIKERTFWFIMAMSMAVFCGLRLQGNDTSLYRGQYMKIVPGAFDINWQALAEAPGFTYFGTVLRTLGVSVQDYLMIESLFVILVYLWFVRKYTSNLWLSAFYFITTGVYTFSFAAIKQTLAVAFLLIATDRAINKKNIRFVFWVCIAGLFHPYAFVYLVIPFLFFEPWTTRTYIILGGTGTISLLLSKVVDRVLLMTEAIGYQYTEEAFTGDGVNIFRVLVVWVPTVLSFFVKNRMKGNLGRAGQVVINASMINSMIMFIGLFGTANYFARLANYFLIFQVLSIPLLFCYINFNNRQLLKFISIVMYLIYFYYEIELAHGSFGDIYKFMEFKEYLKQFFYG